MIHDLKSIKYKCWNEPKLINALEVFFIVNVLH